MKKKKYLPVYKKWLNREFLPGMSGLCLALALELEIPYRFLKEEFFIEPDEPGKFWEGEEIGKFTQNRQNIVLLLAAQNNEL